MDFFADTTWLGEDLDAPYEVTWESVPRGSQALTAVAIDDEGSTGSSSPVRVSVQGPPGDLSVQYGCMETSAVTSSIRYYYTMEDAAPQQFHCDWAQVGSQNVSGDFVQLSGDQYALDITFAAAAGDLDPFDDSGGVQSRFNKTNWSDYNQADDYSFDPSIRNYTDWIQMTLYWSDELVWGLEPLL